MAGETETRKEAEQVNQSVVPVSSDIISVEKSVEQADRYLSVLSRIRLLAIKLTNILDWTNEAGHPYLQKSGCDKIAGAFGVQIFDVTYTKEVCRDDKGEYIMFTCDGNGVWNTHAQHESGTASTRDDFFGTKKENGEKVFKPLSEVDLTDIKKKSHTNMSNRMIKKLLGLSFTWEEIKELSGGKITAESVQKVEYGKGSRGGNTDSPVTKNKRTECQTMLLKLNDGEESGATKMLVDLTAWEKDNGEKIPGRDSVNKLSEKQVDFLHTKLAKKVKEFDAAVAAGQRG